MTRLVKFASCIFLLVLFSGQLSLGQTAGAFSVSYSFDFHECNSPYNEADQPDLRDVASRFTTTNVGCHSSEASFGTLEWPQGTTVDPDKYVGFRLVAPAGHLISLADTDTLWFDVYGGSALQVNLHDASNNELRLFERASTGIFDAVRIPAPISTNAVSGEFEFRIHAFDAQGTVSFDNVETSFQVVESIGIEEVAAQRVDGCTLHGTFPNPTGSTARTRFSAQSGGTAHARLINTLGRTVRNWWIQNGSSDREMLIWETTGLAAGVYLLELSCDGRRSTSLVSIL